MMKQLGKQFTQLQFSRYACVCIFILSSVAMDTVIYSYQVSIIPLLAMILVESDFILVLQCSI